MGYKRRSSESSHDSELLKAALVGYEHERAVIVEKISEIRRQLGGRGAVSTNGAKPARQMSVAARRRIADAQRKRWAAYRKAEKPVVAKKTAVVKAAAKPMRRMSAAARKRISEATKKRWAAFRAKKAPPKARKAA